MIVSYRDKRTRIFAEGKRVKAFDSFARKAEMTRKERKVLFIVQHRPCKYRSRR